MKFSQLIERNMRNIFLEKSYTECDGEISPRLFSEKWKLSISLDQLSKIFYSFVFIVSQVEDYRNILELSWAHLLSPHITLYVLLIDQISLPGCPYFVRHWAICLLELFVNQVVTSWILKLT